MARSRSHLLDLPPSLSEVYLGLAMADALYGGLHVLTWNAPFASQTEELLWRGIVEWENEPLANSKHSFLRLVVLGFRIWITEGFYHFTILLVVFGMLYLFVHIYLIVEYFLNLLIYLFRCIKILAARNTFRISVERQGDMNLLQEASIPK